MIVGRHIRSDINDIGDAKIRDLAGEALMPTIGGKQRVETRLEHWQIASPEAGDQRRIGVAANDLEATRRNRGGRHQPEMGHPDEADDRQVHVGKQPAHPAGVRTRASPIRWRWW